ncbi:MAG: MotA/TolQ/ExbB proton channel family protein [Bacteroidaceae bacterium]|jgi:biopolymer transport protein ExbB|nr:MotA/TolQ/ExbB proton channel family protein [Bacteroidaceae bacterium]
MATTNATAPKGATKKSQGFKGVKAGWIVILICFIIAECLYVFGAGYKTNFLGNEAFTGLPFHFFQEADYEPDGIVGTVYKGGFIVPLIWGQFITVIALAIERFLAIRTANGKGSVGRFVGNIKKALMAGNIAEAEALCDKQQGSVANVVRSTLATYRQVEKDDTLSKEQKVLAIQKELEEATALEMPMMQENLPIIGTIVTLGTLTGLLGTVMGMIKSFSAMAGEGGADSSALSVGISEALVNTASGIATGAAAVIAYNFYTNKIDRLTFCIDEVGFSIVQTFNATH